MATTLGQILKNIGHINVNGGDHVPVLVTGLDNRNFGVAHKKVQFNQIVLAAYKIPNSQMFDGYLHTIENEMTGFAFKVLPFPFDGEHEIHKILQEISAHFNIQIDHSKVISKDQTEIKEFWKFYLFVTLVSSSYFS